MTEKKWLATYLFCNPPFEPILRDAVHPFVQEVMSENLADQYFYIRYFERGPHVRLRFKGDADVLDNQLKPKIDRYFGKYIKENPTVRQDPDWVKDLPENKQWYPNNSIQYITYEPEFMRYGGKHTILSSEKQFQASSDAALELFSITDEWSYERAMGAAIQLHLGMAHALGMDIYETRLFYTDIFQNWLHRAYYYYEHNLSREELDGRREFTLELFERNFEKQREFLIPYHQQVWDAFVEEAEFEEQWINKWLKDLKVVNKELLQLQKENKLEIPKHAHFDEKLGISKEKQDLWFIYESWVHMTNNRIGVLNRDEAFLGYLIKNCLAYIEETTST